MRTSIRVCALSLCVCERPEGFRRSPPQLGDQRLSMLIRQQWCVDLKTPLWEINWNYIHDEMQSNITAFQTQQWASMVRQIRDGERRQSDNQTNNKEESRGDAQLCKSTLIFFFWRKFECIFISNFFRSYLKKFSHVSNRDYCLRKNKTHGVITPYTDFVQFVIACCMLQYFSSKQDDFISFFLKSPLLYSVSLRVRSVLGVHMHMTESG